MISQEPPAYEGAGSAGQLTSIQRKLLRDSTNLRILVILNVCVKTDLLTLTAMLNRDSHLKVEIETVEGCLYRLEQSHLINGHHFTRWLIFWKLPLERPFYSIARAGKIALSQKLATLNTYSK